MIKIYKIFGFKIFQIETYKNNIDVPVKENKEPEGEVLEYSQEQADRVKEQEIINKMERKE